MAKKPTLKEIADAFTKIVRHATDEKSPLTAPLRNRLQNIVGISEEMLRKLGGQFYGKRQNKR